VKAVFAIPGGAVVVCSNSEGSYSASWVGGEVRAQFCSNRDMLPRFIPLQAVPPREYLELYAALTSFLRSKGLS
jgi:hypothetical protein